MVIAPPKEPWHIGRVDMLVDEVFLAQPLRGTRVDRHFGECTLRVLERTDPAFGGGAAALACRQAVTRRPRTAPMRSSRSASI